MKGRTSVVSFGAALACAGLFGCGGGGGGGGPAGLPEPSSTPIAVTASNVGQVTDAALDPAVGGTGAFGASISSTDTPQSNPRVLLRAMQAVSTQAKKPRSSGSPLSDAPVTQACLESGSVTVDGSGTSGTIQFNSCSDFPGEVINGSVTVTGITETSTTFAASFTVDITFTFDGSSPLRMVGVYSISESCASPGVNCTGTFSGSKLGAAHGGEVWFINSFSITSVEGAGFIDVTASYRVSSNHLNGSVQVSTSTPIHFASGATYPESGSIQITGANGSNAVITISSSLPTVSTAVLVQVDTDGIGGFDFQEDYSWNELEAI
jgi:hypothetical protein